MRGVGGFLPQSKGSHHSALGNMSNSHTLWKQWDIIGAEWWAILDLNQ